MEQLALIPSELVHSKLATEVQRIRNVNADGLHTYADLKLTDIYQVLDLPWNADLKMAETKYRQLMLVLHPDKRTPHDEKLAGGRYVCDCAFRTVQIAVQAFQKASVRELDASAFPGAARRQAPATSAKEKMPPPITKRIVVELPPDPAGFRKTFQMDVAASDTVGHVKKQIERAEGIVVAGQRFHQLPEGTVLQDNAVIWPLTRFRLERRIFIELPRDPAGFSETLELGAAANETVASVKDQIQKKKGISIAHQRFRQFPEGTVLEDNTLIWPATRFHLDISSNCRARCGRPSRSRTPKVTPQ